MHIQCQYWYCNEIHKSLQSIHKKMIANVATNITDTTTFILVVHVRHIFLLICFLDTECIM